MKKDIFFRLNSPWRRCLLQSIPVTVGLLVAINAYSETSPNQNLNLVSVSQQNFTITGTVVDDKGEPLIGVNVLEKGTNNGTISDLP